MVKAIKFHILSVGHGDCVLIEFPDNTWAIVDCGSQTIKYKPGSDAAQYIKDNTVYDVKIRFVLVSHHHSDHYSGIKTILKRFEGNIDAFYYGTEPLAAVTGSGEYLEIAKRHFNSGNIKEIRPLKRGDLLHFNDVETTIAVDYPYSNKLILDILDEKMLSRARRIINDNSIILRVLYGETEVLLASDTTDKVLNEIYHKNNLTLPDCIKIPHHGSKDGLNKLSPKKHHYSIISCPSFDESHPDEKVLSMLHGHDGVILRCTGINKHCYGHETPEIYEPSDAQPTLFEKYASIRRNFPNRSDNTFEVCSRKIVLAVPIEGSPQFLHPVLRHCDSFVS